MARQKLQLDQIIDPLQATIIRDPDGTARFDLSGVPRVDALLVGRPLAEVPGLITRLCGLCPVTHHLAGIRALDDLLGLRPSPTAQAVRRLLHHGSVIAVMGVRFLAEDRSLAIALKQVGGAVMAAAGAPGHFPDVAVPGGVRSVAQVEGLSAQLDRVRPRVSSLIDTLPTTWSDTFAGLDVVVVDEAGAPDPLGSWLRAGTTMIPVSSLSEVLVETNPTDIAPRPRLLMEGQLQTYRVGPVARFPSVAPRRAQAMAVQESIDAVLELLSRPELVEGEIGGPPASLEGVTGVGVGVVDGPRGLLVHEYRADGTGRLAASRIITPTAQNEGWMSDMLTTALATGQGTIAVEDAIRAADPCLPCTAAPPGAMNLTIKEA